MKFRKKLNFRITIRYEIPTFSSVGPFFSVNNSFIVRRQQELSVLIMFILWPHIAIRTRQYALVGARMVTVAMYTMEVNQFVTMDGTFLMQMSSVNH